MYNVLLLLHVLAATIWTGGHLVLALAVLPGVLRRKAPAELLRFESAFEKIGIPALLIQVGTGVALAYRLLPDVHRWFGFEDQTSRLIGTKLALLALTMLLAADARLRIIPRLSEENLTSLAWHIIPVTVVSVLFVVVGVSFRTGWLY
ncbi:MAG: copper resistance protein CopD [Gammaproteobacteria bacterium RIFCSPLOWO2_12_FULL_52_10]|nr:MAG: copper resistance protein CopD [Gammaproteobacteria bacterium RIFCSPLOWO2_12_FULL_52_10]